MAADLGLAELVRGKLLGPCDLAFVSGSVPCDGTAVAELMDWLEHRGAGPWWRCLEWTDQVRLEQGAPAAPDFLEMLVWGRWFAATGDLEMWRDGDTFRWRYLGDPLPDGTPPAPGCESDYFAEGGAGTYLRASPEDVQHMLWEHAEARIATADRDTRAFLAGKPRQAAVCTLYYDHGAVAGVRYRAVRDYTPVRPTTGAESARDSALPGRDAE